MQESDNLPIVVAVLSGATAAAVSLLVLALVSLAVFAGYSTATQETSFLGQVQQSPQEDVATTSEETAQHEATSPSSLTASSGVSSTASPSSVVQAIPSHELTIPSLASIGLSQDDYVVGDFNAQVEECLQFPQLPGGCEIASMVSVLRALGFETDLLAFTDDYVLKVEGKPELVYAYSGTPYDAGAGFPPAMARAGNAYLKDQGSHWRFIEPAEASIDDMVKVLEMGRPVLLWTTMYGAAPVFTSIVVEDYEWYSNEHCVVFYGLTEEGDMQIMDPMVGLITQKRATFEDIYLACGQHALVPSQTQTDVVDAAEFALRASFLDNEEASEEDQSTEK